MQKESIKILRNWFIFFFVLGLLIVNWNTVCLISDYRFIYGKIYNFAKEKGIVKEKGENYTTRNLLVIPSLNVKAPIIFAESSNKKALDRALKNGVLYYPDSSLPDQEEGTTVILGHSAPVGWPKVNYDYIFSDLQNLGPNDKFYLLLNDQQYFYKVKNKFFLKKGEEIPKLDSPNSSLVLISCWPPGKNQNRIAVQAVLR